MSELQPATVSELRLAFEDAFELLGGVTAANARLTMEELANYVRFREILLYLPEEARQIRSEDTRAWDYPVPHELLPFAYPGPPVGFSSPAYNRLAGALDTLVQNEALPWGILNFPAREARTLQLLRKICSTSQNILLELVRTAEASSEALPPTPTPSSDPELHTAAPIVYLEPTEVWAIYKVHAVIVRLTLGAPLLNTRTARVPPIVLELLVLDFSVIQQWTQECTTATLAMLGEPLIPALTFVCPPPWLIREFFANGPGVQDLQYRMSRAGTTVNVRTTTGRSFEFADTCKAIEAAVFTSEVFRTITAFAISDCVVHSLISRIRHLVPGDLTSIDIEFDEYHGDLGVDMTSLLTYYGRRLALFSKVTVVRLVLAPHVPPSFKLLRLPLVLVNAFLASAFPPGVVFNLGVGVVVD